MITKNKIKYIKSLQQKKFRSEHNSFVIEGVKMVKELLISDFELEEIYAEKTWIAENTDNLSHCTEVSEKELKSISNLTTANRVIAIAKQKNVEINPAICNGKLNLVLDRIQDPGNLGTIIRIADWFGIQNIICSNDSVEQYNPKVIQATMGAVFRVNIFYTDLELFNQLIKKENKQKIYGTLLEGENIYNKNLNKEGFIVMGNESEGISPKLIPYIDEKIHIPNYSSLDQKTESLNVATAASIVCAEFRRQNS